MSEWWYVLVIVIILAVAGALYLRSRNRRGGNTGAPVDPARNYRDERETSRLGGMSDEDREWEAASLDRNRRAQERDQESPADAGDERRP